MINLSGPDKQGVWFKPGAFFPLWKEWDPMVVMISRSVGSAMFGAFPVGWYVLPRASYLKQATLLNAIYLGFFTSAAFSSVAVVETFRFFLLPAAAFLTAVGCYVLFTSDNGEGLPKYTPLTDSVEAQLIKSGRASKSIGLNSETYINAILLLWGTLGFFWTTDMNLLTPAGPLPVPMFLIVFNRGAIWFAQMWTLTFLVMALGNRLFDAPAILVAKQLLAFFSLYYLIFSIACIEHARFDTFIALFGLPVGALFAFNVKTVYDDYMGGLPL